MQQLLSNFLLQHGHCPLPGVGTLTLEEVPANIDLTTRTINPPSHIIKFSSEVTKPKAFLAYAMEMTGLEKENLKPKLYDLADQINFLPVHGTRSFAGLGDFYREGSGKLFFKPSSTAQLYQKTIPANKVIRQDASHAILVGDKETSTANMQAFFADEEPARVEKWWIAALVIILISAILIFLHYYQYQGNSIFGNHT